MYVESEIEPIHLAIYNGIHDLSIFGFKECTFCGPITLAKV